MLVVAWVKAIAQYLQEKYWFLRSRPPYKKFADRLPRSCRKYYSFARELFSIALNLRVGVTWNATWKELWSNEKVLTVQFSKDSGRFEDWITYESYVRRFDLDKAREFIKTFAGSLERKGYRWGCEHDKSTLSRSTASPIPTQRETTVNTKKKSFNSTKLKTKHWITSKNIQDKNSR